MFIIKLKMDSDKEQQKQQKQQKTLYRQINEDAYKKYMAAKQAEQWKQSQRVRANYKPRELFSDKG